MADTPSPLPFTGFTATALAASPRVVGDAGAGTLGAPAFSPFSNTKDIIFFNRSNNRDLFVKVVDFAAGVPAAITAADSTVVPPGGAITLGVGVAGERGNFDEGGAGSRLVILVQADVANVIFNCTYVQGSGLPG